MQIYYWSDVPLERKTISGLSDNYNISRQNKNKSPCVYIEASEEQLWEYRRKKEKNNSRLSYPQIFCFSWFDQQFQKYLWISTLLQLVHVLIHFKVQTCLFREIILNSFNEAFKIFLCLLVSGSLPSPSSPDLQAQKSGSHRIGVVSVQDSMSYVLSHSVRFASQWEDKQSCLNSFGILFAAERVVWIQVTAFANTGLTVHTQICQREAKKECPSINWILMSPGSRLGTELFHCEFQTSDTGMFGLSDLLNSPGGLNQFTKK